MNKWQKQPWWIWGIGMLVLIELGLTAYQYFHLSLDGDLAPIVLPAEHYAKTLADPFALSTWGKGEQYAGAGRAFSHWWLKVYFDNFPGYLQSFLTPIDSLYGAAALFRWAAHLSFLFLLVNIARPVFATKHPKYFWLSSSIVGLGLAFPLLQVGGFHEQIGLVNRSVSYAAFYAWPLVGLLWWWAPYLRAALRGESAALSSISAVLRCLLALPLALSGPLVGPTQLVLLAVIIAACWLGRIPRWKVSFLPILIFTVFAAYAFFVGRWNSETPAEVPSLFTRYQDLVGGLWYQFSLRLGMPLLVLGLAVNFYLARKWLPPQQWQALRQFGGILLAFLLLYLLLLPLGGWRQYRSSIIRVDTQLPITIGLLLLLISSSWRLLLSTLSHKRRFAYGLALGGYLLIFQLADVNLSAKNECERSALETLRSSQQAISLVAADCSVLGWDIVESAEQSRLTAEFLLQLSVTDSLRLFKQE
ncbi:MAG: hypothetical protein AAF433_14355 [Bacteroidota bacterium]